MAVTVKHLVSGEMPVSENTIYTSPANTTTKITRVVLTNTTTDVITVSFWRNDGSKRLLTTFKVPPGSGNSIDAFDLQGANLEATHLIAAMASDVGVNYQIDGEQIS